MANTPNQPPANLTNPLAEARPDSLARYFAMDPLDLTRQDRDIIVAELRRMRQLWTQQEAAGATRATRVPGAPKDKPAKQPPKRTMTIEDLDL